MNPIVQTSMRSLAPAGEHNAICIAAFDLGVQRSSKPSWPNKRQIALMFEMDSPIAEGPLAGQRHRLSKTFSATLNESGTLMKTLVTWFGKDPTCRIGATRQFNPAELVGKPCVLTVVHVERDGATKARIASITMHRPGMPVLSSDYDPAEVLEWVLRRQSERLDKPSTQPPAPREDQGKPAPLSDDWESILDEEDEDECEYEELIG